MLIFAPNVSWLFPELPFGKRLQAVYQAGFQAIEFGFPSHADIAAIEAAKKQYNLEVILFNQDVPVWDAANQGYLVDIRRRDEFRRKFEEAIDLSRRLSAMKIMLPAGVRIADTAFEAQRDCMVENLIWAAPIAKEANLLLTIEVLNPNDNPGYFLVSPNHALEIVKEVNHPNIKYQLDTYHIQVMSGGLNSEVIEKIINDNIYWIGHIQFADAPGRHEPGTGVIKFDRIISTIEQAGYEGYIGLEYKPLAQGGDALRWVPEKYRKKS